MCYNPDTSTVITRILGQADSRGAVESLLLGALKMSKGSWTKKGKCLLQATKDKDMGAGSDLTATILPGMSPLILKCF